MLVLACSIGFEPTVSGVGVLCIIQLCYEQRLYIKLYAILRRRSLRFLPKFCILHFAFCILHLCHRHIEFAARTGFVRIEVVCTKHREVLLARQYTLRVCGV